MLADAPQVGKESIHDLLDGLTSRSYVELQHTRERRASGLQAVRVRRSANHPGRDAYVSRD
jgi:hypothetical protein